MAVSRQIGYFQPPVARKFSDLAVAIFLAIIGNLDGVVWLFSYFALF